MPEFKIKDKINITWEEIRILREIAEEDFNTRDITKIMTLILKRNLKVILKLYRYYEKFNGKRDIADFIRDDVE